jgi:hypothetical protein
MLAISGAVLVAVGLLVSLPDTPLNLSRTSSSAGGA